MRQIFVNAVLLAAMLTIGKFTTDAGYWASLAMLIIGALIGAGVFAVVERRRKHKSNAAKSREHQAVEHRNAAHIAQFVESQRER